MLKMFHVEHFVNAKLYIHNDTYYDRKSNTQNGLERMDEVAAFGNPGLGNGEPMSMHTLSGCEESPLIRKERK